MYSNNIVATTKKYIIDVLNSMCFSGATTFEGKSQFFDLNTLKVTFLENEFVLDQRGALFLNKYNNLCFKLLISCVRNNSYVQSVGYRLSTPKEEFNLEEKKIRLFSQLKLDYSIADTSFSVKDDSALSFYDNIGYIGDQKDRLFSILKFIMDSNFVGCYLPEVFSDVLSESISLPPSITDIHYDPIFSV